jgi:hypothetical protein
MERRTFLLALFGGVIAAATAPSLAEAASRLDASPADPVRDALSDRPEAVEVSAETTEALDAADKEFAQYGYYYRRPVRRVYYRRPVRRVYYRPVVYRRPVRRVYYRRPVYYRPVRRVYYRRPVRVMRAY